MVTEPLVVPSPSLAAPREASSRRAAKALPWTLGAFILLAAAFLRFHALAAKSLWVDEGLSVGIARLRWPQFFLLLWQREANMGLYYLLLHFWIMAGSGEAFLRALSVLFSIATVPLLYALGARLFGRPTGLLAAWLLAINAYHVRYAQEARSYALLVFLAVLSTWLLVRNLQRPAEARWGAYSLVSALMVYAHLFGGLVVVAHAASLLWFERRAVPWRDFGRSLRWFGLLILPMAVAFVHIGSGQAAWLAFPHLADLSSFFQSMAGNRGLGPVLLDAAFLAVAAFAAWRKWRSAGRNLESWAYLLVFVWLIVPLAIVLAVSAVKPVFLARYLIFSLPALLLGVAAGIARLRPAPVAWALCAWLSVFSLQGTFSYYHRDFDIYREDWRSASAYILDNSRPGDAIFFSTFARMPYEYYRSQRRPVPAGPAILNSPGAPELQASDFQVRSVAEMLQDARSAPDRVWLVLFLDHTPVGQLNPTSTMLRAVYENGRSLVQKQEFPQITVYLFAKQSAPVNQTEINHPAVLSATHVR
jgi:mannosyltransferase